MNAPAIMDVEALELQAGQPHILAVDDDPAMRKLIADYLAETKCGSRRPSTGEA